MAKIKLGVTIRLTARLFISAKPKSVAISGSFSNEDETWCTGRDTAVALEFSAEKIQNDGL